MKIYTSYLTAEKFFYRECLNSQREYCKMHGYEFIEIENLEINEEASWRNLRAFEGVIISSTDPVIWFKPSLMIMDPTFTIKDIYDRCGQSDLIVTRHRDTYIDSILIAGTDSLFRKTIDFIWKFRNVSSDSDFPFKMMESVTDKYLKPVPPRAMVSLWYTYDMKNISVDIDTSVDFPKIKADDAMMQTLHSPEVIYAPGDFSVDLGNNKEMVKILSREFNVLRMKILDKYQESQKILEDARKYQRT